MASNTVETRIATLADTWPTWPTYGLIDDLLPTLAHWRNAGEWAALATLVDITGSSPRPLGSEMAVSANGEVAGYVSGGCVEGAVAAEALSVIASGKPVWLDYGADSLVLDVQLLCGGRIGIFVRPLPDLAAYVERLRYARAKRRPLQVAINLESGRHHFGEEVPGSKGRFFFQNYLPPPRLLLAGGDPITLALCHLAPLAGFEVGLLRPYGPSAPPSDVPLFVYDNRPLSRALNDLALDEWTAVYTLTHDIDDDHAILVRALQSPAFAVGVLGSRSKIGDRTARLRAAGVDTARIARLNMPAGLDLTAREPREIALSMLAELISQRPRAASLRCESSRSY